MADLRQQRDRFLPPSAAHESLSEFARAFNGQTVCIAGSAGYIGSALARALAAHSPRTLLLLDSSEQGLFEIQCQFRVAYPKANCEYVLGSVDDTLLLNDVFRRSHPDVVFHAATFKHVGLLESNPFAALQNNTIGTHTLVAAALQQGVATLVVLSTDKTVNPHSVMAYPSASLNCSPCPKAAPCSAPAPSGSPT